MTEQLLDIKQSIVVDAPIAKVWKVLTEPVFVDQWLGCLRYQKSVGHVFYMQQDQQKRQAGNIDGATHCRILALDEPGRFVFSWYLPGTPETEVSINLRSLGDATEVTLVHAGWDQFDSEAIRAIRDGLEGGWKSFVLPQLKQTVEHAG